MAGFWHPDIGYWQTNTDDPSGDITGSYPEGTVKVPTRPNPSYTWNGVEWVHQEADERMDWRQGRTVTKAEFLSACWKAGHLTQQDAKKAAKGDVPPSLAAYLSGLPDDQAVDAEIMWSSTGDVRRLSPLVEGMTTHLNLTPEQVDAIFGWDG